MRSRFLLPLALPLLLAGCLVPRGQPVVLDARSGSWWTGDGVLIERSADGERCRVAARTRSTLVEKRWVPCRYVHERPRRN